MVYKNNDTELTKSYQMTSLMQKITAYYDDSD